MIRSETLPMRHLQDAWRQLACDTRGITAIEYAVIGLLISVAILAALKALANGDNSTWGNAATQLINAMQGG
jgi:Flp pilus assembly pilin Flp